MIIETIIYIALIIALFLVCDNRFSRRYYVPLKVVCSTSFLIILIINQFYSPKLWLMFWPLFACFLGDILLGLFNTYKRKRFMIIGIIAFMLGHVAFLNYMCRIQPDTNPWVYIAPVATVGAVIVIHKTSHLHMGVLFVPSLIYSYFVTCMTLKAVECGLHGKPLLGIAGVLFLISDFTILFLYFYHYRNKTNKRIIHYVNLGTYYLAIYLFLVSL